MELTVNDLRTSKQSVKTYYVIITNKDGIRKYISSPKSYWESFNIIKIKIMIIK